MFAGSRLLLPVPINFITLVPKPGRKEGHAVREPSLLSGIAVLRRSGSRKWRRPPGAARSGGAGAKEEQVGWKTRCRAPGTRRGGCHPRGSGGVGAVRQWAGACCHPPGWWRSRERGTRCRLPSTGGAIAGRQEAEGASGRPPKRSSTIAWHREWAAQLVEDRAAVCPGTGPRFIFFSLPSLVVVTPHLTLPKLLRGTRDRWAVQVSFITNYSTGLAPFPRLSAPPHSPQTLWLL